MPEPALVLYSGVLVSFHVPRDCRTAEVDAAIAMIRRDIEKSIRDHLPPECAADLQTMA